MVAMSETASCQYFDNACKPVERLVLFLVGFFYALSAPRRIHSRYLV